ncbi:unnamed protein product [Caenorhabditis auriculariae]|uniref:G-protein coupled receptors family 1 profile domain-containing protein n=1 Tax=Caenorhabditis auriculariae TaxID=2777116 RepID=A0A8S1H7Z1_9PELO|nr:unnamed protein product [Caenorhabditis auriculariae]
MATSQMIFVAFHSTMSLTGMILNGTLIYLTLFHSPTAIKNYSTLILNFAFIDFSACIADFFVQQRLIPSGWSLIYMSSGRCRFFGPKACYIGYSVMLHFFAHSLWCLLISFSYRYYVLTRPAPSTRSLMTLLFIVYIPSFVQMVTFIFAQDPSEELVKILKERFPTYEIEGTMVTGTLDLSSFFCLFTLFHMTLPVTPIYITILVLRRKIINKLELNAEYMQKDTKVLHRQLLTALTYQAVIPSFFLLTVLTYAFGHITGYHSPWLEYATFSLILFIPVLSPISSLVFMVSVLQIIFIFFHTTVALSGCFLNALLFYLAFFHSPSSMKSYATLIMNFAVTDFLACLTDAFTEQRLIPADWALLYFSNGVCGFFGPRACYIGYSLMLHFFSHSLWSLLVSFVYRLYILHKRPPHTRTLLLIMLLVYTPSLFQCITFMGAQDPQKEVEAALFRKFPWYELNGATLTGTVDIRSFSALFTILHMTVPITPVYISILVIRRKIIKKLSNATAKMGNKTKAMHKQLLTALTYQAAIPSFFWFAVFSYSIGQFGIYNHEALEYVVFCSVVMIPVLSPLATLVFVRPYREKIKQFFSNRLTKNADTSPTSIAFSSGSKMPITT